MKATNANAKSTAVPREMFGTPEAEAHVKKQVKAFLAHTNNTPVVRELESVLKSARDSVGWRRGGQLFLEVLKEASFPDEDAGKEGASN